MAHIPNHLVVYVSMDALFPQNYLFIWMLSSRLTTKTYFSIQLFVCMPIYATVHQLFILILSFRPTGTVFRSTSLRLYRSARPSIQIYLFSLIFPSGKTCTVTCQLIYWPTYPQTYPKLNQPVSLDGFYFG